MNNFELAGKTLAYKWAATKLLFIANVLQLFSNRAILQATQFWKNFELSAVGRKTLPAINIEGIDIG